MHYLYLHMSLCLLLLDHVREDSAWIRSIFAPVSRMLFWKIVAFGVLGRPHAKEVVDSLFLGIGEDDAWPS